MDGLSERLSMARVKGKEMRSLGKTGSAVRLTFLGAVAVFFVSKLLKL